MILTMIGYRTHHHRRTVLFLHTYIHTYIQTAKLPSAMAYCTLETIGRERCVGIPQVVLTKSLNTKAKNLFYLLKGLEQRELM